MAKIKSLSGAPADFHIPVTVHELDGTGAEIIFTFKGRTLRDWHPMALKRMTEDANMMIDAAEEREKLAEATVGEAEAEEGQAKRKKTKHKRLEYKEKEAHDVMQKGLARSAEIIQEVAIGWDLEDEFNEDNLKTLCARYPGVHQRAWEKYDARIRGNRLGN